MTGWTDWEREQNARTRQVVARILADDQLGFPVDRFGYGPPVALTCPAGHRLLTVRGWVADVDGKPWLNFEPVGTLRRSGPRASRGDVPWVRHAAVDPTPGVEVVDELRARFTCPLASHGWTDTDPYAALVARYALAAVAGWDRVAVVGAGVSRTRRARGVR